VLDNNVHHHGDGRKADIIIWQTLADALLAKGFTNDCLNDSLLTLNKAHRPSPANRMRISGYGPNLGPRNGERGKATKGTAEERYITLILRNVVLEPLHGVFVRREVGV